MNGTNRGDYRLLLFMASLGALFTCGALLWLINRQQQLIANTALA